MKCLLQILSIDGGDIGGCKSVLAPALEQGLSRPRMHVLRLLTAHPAYYDLVCSAFPNSISYARQATRTREVEANGE